MPLDPTSASPSTISLRSLIRQARLNRADNQIAAESLFYDQLLRFPVPESNGRNRSDSSLSEESPFATGFKSPGFGASQSEETRDQEPTDATEEDPDSSNATPSNGPSDGAIAQNSSPQNRDKRHDTKMNRSSEDQDANALDADKTRTANDASDARNGEHTTIADPQDPANRNSQADDSAEPQQSDRLAPLNEVLRKGSDQSSDKTQQAWLDSSLKRSRDPKQKTQGNSQLDVNHADIQPAATLRVDETSQSVAKRAGRASASDARSAPSLQLGTEIHGTADSQDSSVEAQDSARSRRRADRAGTRNRISSERQRETSDRLGASERVASDRTESVAVSRELAGPKSTENPSNLGYTNPSAFTVAASASVTSTNPVAISPSSVTTDSSAKTPTDSLSSSQALPAESGDQRAAPATAASSSPHESNSARPVPSTVGSNGARLTHYQETKLVQRVMRGMEQLSNGGGQVRLRLHPPELGSLQMSLRIEGNTVFAEMQVETSLARDALMKNLPVLKERLAEQGIQIEYFDVQADGKYEADNFNTSSQSSQSGSDSGSGGQNSRYLASQQNRLSIPEVDSSIEAPRRWNRSLGQLDFEA